MRPTCVSAGLILRPSVAVTQAWVLAATCWTFLALFTAQAPRYGEPLRLIDARSFALVSVAHAALVVLLLAELPWVLRAPLGLRRVQLVGQAGALVLLVYLQELARLAHGATP
jgi:hypothetical protein